MHDDAPSDELRRLQEAYEVNTAIMHARTNHMNELREQLEKKSDAIQNLWKERDVLRDEVKRLRAVLAQAVADIRAAETGTIRWPEYEAAIKAAKDRLVIALAERGDK